MGIISSGLVQVIYEERMQRELKSCLVRLKPKFFKYKNHCDPNIKAEV